MNQQLDITVAAPCVLTVQGYAIPVRRRLRLCRTLLTVDDHPPEEFATYVARLEEPAPPYVETPGPSPPANISEPNLFLIKIPDGTNIHTISYRDGHQTSTNTQGLLIQGNVNTVSSTSGNVAVTGSVQSVSTVSGTVRADTINGNVKTTSGTVHANRISGSVSSSSGSIKTQNF